MTLTPSHKRQIFTASMIVTIICALAIILIIVTRFLALQHQNISISQTNGQRIKCLALIKPDDRTAQNIQDCFDKNLLPGESTPAVVDSNVVSSPSPAVSPANTSTPTATASTQGQGSEQNTNKPLNCKIDLLSIHIGCP